ncbi:hypothetical protein ACH4UM_26225 [Streptomyces sp. NPDC020801]
MGAHGEQLPAAPDPVILFLGTLKAGRAAFTARHPKITVEADGARVLAAS